MRAPVTLGAYASRLLRSPALVAAAMLAAGGVGFALANVLLAKVMVQGEFGSLTLFVALTQLALSVGPLGLETAISRHRLDATGSLLLRAVISSALIGTTLAGFAAFFYEIGTALALLLGLAAMGASVNRIATAFLQSHGRFGRSLVLLQIHNYVLIVGVPLLLLLNRQDALPVAGLVVSAYVATAVFGWFVSLRLPHRNEPSVAGSVLLREGLAAAGIGFATQVLWQLERLVIPRTLSAEDLAMFAVFASVAGSPFRMMQTGIGYTLLPGLRNCDGRRAVMRLLYREAASIVVLAVAAIAGALYLVPWVMNRLLSGRYGSSPELLAAILVVGIIKLWYGFASSIVPALGAATDLALLNGASWVAVLVGVACAYVGSDFGLAGIVYGVGFAWLFLAGTGTVLSLRIVRKLS